jgi:hypothetical protein
VGTTNGNAISGIVAGVEGVPSLNGCYGVYRRPTSSSPTQAGIGVYGQSDSPSGLGLSGWAAGAGDTIGSSFAINTTETANSGNTVGLVARVVSPSRHSSPDF